MKVKFMQAQILRPTLLIDKVKCINNINRMIDKASGNKLIFRPHFKTHQSILIGEWYRAAGVNKITVSSVKMAEYFASNKWNDITIAFPVNVRETEQINSLSAKINLNLLVADIQTIDLLRTKIITDTGIYVELDLGYHRSGIDISKLELLKEIVNKISGSSFLRFKGFLTHAGDTYNAENPEMVSAVHLRNIKLLNSLRKIFIADWPELIISIGDTPSCSVSDNFGGIDEIRPGNFVFYDLMQQKLGVCLFKDIGVIVLAPVVSLNNTRDEIVIYGGGIHLSKEYLVDNEGRKYFGKVVFPDNDLNWGDPEDGSYLAGLSQEHGIIKASKNMMRNINIGDLVGIMPVHSCLTANLIGKYTDKEGDRKSVV